MVLSMFIVVVLRNHAIKIKWCIILCTERWLLPARPDCLHLHNGRKPEINSIPLPQDHAFEESLAQVNAPAAKEFASLDLRKSLSS